MKKYLWAFLGAFLPLGLLVLIAYVNITLDLLSQPSDISVLAGVCMFCILLLIFLFIISKITKSK